MATTLLCQHELVGFHDYTGSIPRCDASVASFCRDVTARLWDLTMLNGHGMLFRLSMAILSCITVSELGTLDTLCATEESTFQHIVQEARSLSVEVIISAAFTNPSFSDIERDFTRLVSLLRKRLRDTTVVDCPMSCYAVDVTSCASKCCERWTHY